MLANGGVVSPGCRSRQSSTRCTPMLSSVQPVTAIDPASTVASPAGVSKLPNGGEAGAVRRHDVQRHGDRAGGVRRRRSASSVMLPRSRCRTRAAPASNFTATVSAPAPEPDAGVTVSHGLFDVAVQLTAAPARLPQMHGLRVGLVREAAAGVRRGEGERCPVQRHARGVGHELQPDILLEIGDRLRSEAIVADGDGDRIAVALRQQAKGEVAVGVGRRRPRRVPASVMLALETGLPP